MEKSVAELYEKIGSLSYDKKYAEDHIEDILSTIKKNRETITTFFIEGYLEGLLRNLKQL